MSALLLYVMESVIRARFLTRVLGRRYPLLAVVAAVSAVDFAASELNVTFSLARTPLTNQLYYFVISLALYCVLFPGGVLKKAFYSLLLWMGDSAAFYGLATVAVGVLGIDMYAAGWQQLLLESLSVALRGGLFEWMGRRFSRLRHDLPDGYVASLLLLAGFVYLALMLMGDTTLTIASEAGTAFAPSALLCSVLSAAGVALSVLAVLSTDRLLTQRLAAQQYELLAAQCRSRGEEARRTAGIQHDMKNHLLCMESLLRAGHPREAADYLERLTQVVEQLGEGTVTTGNLFADAVVVAKLGEAKRRGIAVEAELAIPQQMELDPVELCCVLSNVLDNAIEACGRLGERGPGRIEARAFARQNQLVLEVRNTMPEASAEKGPGHGLGLENVRRAVLRCGGALDLTREDGMFCFSAMLPLG